MVKDPDPHLLPKDLRRRTKVIKEQKNAAEAEVAARVKIVVVDHVEEEENENEKSPERTTGPLISVLLDLCLDHTLPRRRSHGHILQRHYHVQLLPPTIPENAGGSEDLNAVANDSTTDLRHEQTSIRKMNLPRIKGRFSFLSWS